MPGGRPPTPPAATTGDIRPPEVAPPAPTGDARPAGGKAPAAAGADVAGDVRPPTAGEMRPPMQNGGPNGVGIPAARWLSPPVLPRACPPDGVGARAGFDVAAALNSSSASILCTVKRMGSFVDGDGEGRCPTRETAGPLYAARVNKHNCERRDTRHAWGAMIASHCNKKKQRATKAVQPKSRTDLLRRVCKSEAECERSPRDAYFLRPRCTRKVRARRVHGSQWVSVQQHAPLKMLPHRTPPHSVPPDAATSRQLREYFSVRLLEMMPK
jgi:hypothetical protein